MIKYILLIIIALLFGFRFLATFRGEIDAEELLYLGVSVICFLIICCDMFNYIAMNFLIGG